MRESLVRKVSTPLLYFIKNVGAAHEHFFLQKYTGTWIIYKMVKKRAIS